LPHAGEVYVDSSIALYLGENGFKTSCHGMVIAGVSMDAEDRGAGAVLFVIDL